MRRKITGSPVNSRQLAAISLPKRFALPLLGSDGISSVAYAADEVIFTLAAGGTSALVYSPWVGVCIAVAGLGIVGTYRYNIRQVALEGDFELVHRKLGRRPAVLLGSSVLLDFVLTVAVSMSSAATFVVTALPQLEGYHQLIAVFFIVLLTLVCLRGVQTMGKIAYWPLYLFLAILGGTIVFGLVQLVCGNLGRAASADYPPEANNPQLMFSGLGLVLLLSRSFSAGAVALSGVSTLSNSVRFFRPPKQHNAALSLMIMIVTTSALLISILYLAHATGVHPTPEGLRREPVLYQLAATIYGNHIIPVLLSLATVAVLVVASFTAFVGFPVSASAIADRHYLPHRLRSIDSAGLYANGVLLLGSSAVLITLVFAADVFALIQLYLVGMCTYLLLTQVAVVRYRVRRLRITLNTSRRRRLARDTAVSVVGVAVTALVLLTVVATKFLSGAWLSVLFILLLAEVMLMTRRHYARVEKLTDISPDTTAAEVGMPSRVHALVYVERVRAPALRALAYARASRPSTLEALTVNNDRQQLELIKQRWDGLRIPVQLSVIDSPFRDTVSAIVGYIRRQRRKFPHDVVVLYLPEFVVGRWWARPLHRRTVHRLKKALLYEPGVVTATVPWVLQAATDGGSIHPSPLPEAGAKVADGADSRDSATYRPAVYRGKNEDV